MSSFRPLLLSALALSALPALAQAPAKALNAVSAKDLLAHIKTLASDEFEGRAPGTAGETRTVAYIGQEFKKLGLKPGNPDGSWVQAVPMRGQKPAPSFSYTIAGKQVALNFPTDYVAHSTSQPATVKVNNSEIVFVGYGARIRLGRLQGRGRARQNAADADQRPGHSRSEQPGRAGPGHVQRQGHDLLRPLDLQIRDRRQAGRGRRDDHS
jgi:hypothetical protein